MSLVVQDMGLRDSVPKHPEVFDKVEVYVDGGFRRGTDVLKALCLGAKACGFGRPFLYANAAYGEAGVVKTIDSKSSVTLAGCSVSQADRRGYSVQ